MKVIKSYPACDIVEMDNIEYNLNGEYVNVLPLKADDELALTSSDYLRKYKIGSAVSYALKTDRDPIAMVERAKANGHKLHWINALSTVITSHRQERVSYIAVDIGQIVLFEGLLFEIVAEANNNLGLKLLIKDQL